MNAAELRAVQGPLKEKYRNDPDSAATPVRASATFAEDGLTATVDGFAGTVRAGLHPAAGGSGDDACSGDMLLEALLGCAGVTLRTVATAMGLQVRSARLEATGSFDVRGTLGVDRTVPVGVTGIEITAEVDTDADDEALAKLARSTERYCVVARSLAEPPTFTVRRAG
ncbi:OsmC family protein [Georgenia alba]|uniref:OsmC family protein n=1 Tax=Georgenia alba TaxID=2233858 RepID=A0ABW2Q3K4_9MICO